MIQPPEAAAAFAVGLQDASGDVRRIASAGWMRATAIPEEVIPALIQALSDPESQVRANVAHALSRLDSIPPESIPRLVECAADPSDGLRISAALALKLAPPGDVRAIMEHLVADPNLRVRLLAAGSLLAADPGNSKAAAVVVEALGDPALRLRKAALQLVDSFGENGRAFAEAVRQRQDLEEDAELRQIVARLIERFSTVDESPAGSVESSVP